MSIRSFITMRRLVNRAALLAVVIALPILASCGEDVNEGTKTQLTETGFSEEESSELSKLKLNEAEVEQLAIAKQGGLDGTAAEEIVRELHDKDLDFDLGKELQVLSAAGFTSTALVQLVEMGAVRHWEADLRVMKHAEIGESTIVKIAERRFVEGKNDVLSGNEYATLKKAGMSDLGLENFVEKKGTPKQMQEVELALRMGESEQAAMKKAGL